MDLSPDSIKGSTFLCGNQIKVNVMTVNQQLTFYQSMAGMVPALETARAASTEDLEQE